MEQFIQETFRVSQYTVFKYILVHIIEHISEYILVHFKVFLAHILEYILVHISIYFNRFGWFLANLIRMV